MLKLNQTVSDLLHLKMKTIYLAILPLLLVVSLLFVTRASAVSAPKCEDAKPSDTPRIRKVEVFSNRIKISTTSVAYDNSYYFIAFGFKDGDERFGVQFPYGPTPHHWVNYFINDLAPSTTYYFKVRGGNGCKPGNWSTSVKAKTPVRGSQTYYFN